VDARPERIGEQSYTGTTTTRLVVVLSKSGGRRPSGDGPRRRHDAATVQETAADQVADASSVTVTTGATLNLNGNSDAIGGLTLTGGR